MRGLLLLLCAVLILSSAFTACGGEGDSLADSSAASAEESVFSEAGGSGEGSEESTESTDTEEDKNLRYHTKTYTFDSLKGEHENTVIENGVLKLKELQSSGSFVCKLDIGSFDTILASWSANTHKGKVELAVSFEVEGGEWSDYLSWGPWSSKEGVSASVSNKCSKGLGKIGIDILTVDKGHTATGNIKVKLSLRYGSKSPEVRDFSLTTPQMEKQQTVDTAALPESFLNDVPMRSQLAPENGSDGNRICSPTTAVMALEYMGTKLDTMTAAKGIYDNGWQAYGNWSFAVAYTAEKGYTAYVDLYDREMMKYALSQGCTVGCSTYLTASGHLVLVVGYTVIDGVEYYIVNDPNVNAANPVRTNYTMDYFEDCWLRDNMNGYGVAYVFEGK